ncbi:MAG TPA: L-histidine N(alpha)-methyltransferase [Candidatus Saccharimonadales bacterium]|nr:L-histidine N(alpha)-methyltransferase [Candidatus Saccharimonadales bacterium]
MATYFKNTELASRYNISEATVRNWVKSARDGKLALILTQQRGRFYVANEISNIPIIEDLVKSNRKYRNTLTSRTVSPSAELFSTYNVGEIYDIIRSLELHREIPRQYGYFGKGAKDWDEYIGKQMSVDVPSIVRRSIELLAANYSYLDERLAKFKKVNVIDIGVGNGRPVKELLEHLIVQGKAVHYLGLDFSNDMLDIAIANLKGWLGERVTFSRHQLDIAQHRFADKLFDDYFRPEQDTVNLVLFLGATPANLRNPSDAFRAICDSMNPNDILIYTDGINPKRVPEWFEHSYESRPRKPEILDRHKFVFNLLNIHESFYTPELGFDLVSQQSYSRAKLKYALKLVFDLGSGRRVVNLEKGDSITVWRCWQPVVADLMNILESTGFYVLHTSQSQDHNYILTIAEVKRS